ncbi:MAG: 3D domain-containing protein [Deltaproteobacteria bacterium]|nr:3D domain-containing protein [Deltaproteobacteria bacterium]
MSFTRSVISFTGKSVLIGLCLPGLVLASQAKSHLPTKKHPTKSHLAAKKHTQPLRKKAARPKLANPLTQECADDKGNLLELKFSTPSETNSPRQEENKDTQTLPLGTFTVRAYTHYAPRAKTASGVWPRSGRTVAVDPDIIPFGTRIYIEGVGERIAEDSGTHVKGRQLDLFFPSVSHCVRFGVQKRDVQLVLD